MMVSDSGLLFWGHPVDVTQFLVLVCSLDVILSDFYDILRFIAL